MKYRRDEDSRQIYKRKRIMNNRLCSKRWNNKKKGRENKDKGGLRSVDSNMNEIEKKQQKKQENKRKRRRL